MTLHEAIIYALEGYSSAMSSAEIAQRIFEKKLYLQQEGSMAPAKRIGTCARKYPQFFIIEDGKIHLKVSLDFTDSQENKTSINLCQFTSPPFPKSKCKENSPSVSQDMSSNLKQGPVPWVNEETKVPILGTMPGDISVQQQSYCPNPRNTFWEIINNLSNSMNRLEKSRSFLNNIGIGLRDIYKEGLRKGSLDRGFIGSPSTSEIKDLLNQYQSIRHLVLNGQKAYKAFPKTIGKVNIPCYVFPSTSSAYSRMTFEEKLKVWTKLKELLK